MEETKRTMRRADRQLSDEQTLEILMKGEYGVLATVSPEGQPYGVPVNYFYQDGCIYMHGTKDGGLKVDNLRSNDRASFTVVGGTELMPEKFGTKYSSAICFGRVEILEEREEKRPWIEGIMMKYSPQFREGGLKYIEGAIDKLLILRMRVDSMTGKARVK